MGFNRRQFIQGATALGVASTMSSAHAKEELSVVEWSPPYLDAAKKVAAKWDKAEIVWTIHSGGATAILAKIKAAWPNPLFDVVTNWSLGIPSMIREGWLETITLADVPNLADVSDKFISKDDKGNVKSVPRSIDGSYFAVRADHCPIEIKSIEDLLNPKLKGQIAWPAATLYTGAPILMLALPRGGSEHNLEPGWKFLQALAKSGNIGRTFNGNVEMSNTITTGDTSVIYCSNGSMSALAKRGVPMKALTKVDPTLKTAFYVEAYTVMANSKKKTAAMEFVNFCASRENSEFFHQNGIDSVPANSKAKPGGNVAAIEFTPQELDKFTYVPDWAYMGTQLDAIVKRFERDITPNL
jgi:putative spermidine/putrescine transport system substrate-binding protein